MRPWLRARSRLQRIALGAAVLLLVVGIAALVIRSEAAVRSYQQTASDARDRGLNPIEFHFDHSTQARAVEAARAPTCAPSGAGTASWWRA